MNASRSPALTSEPAHAHSPADADLGRRLTELTIGLDRFERRALHGDSPLEGEGLVPIYLGDDLVPPLELTGWDEALEHLEGLEREAAAYPVSPRRTFLLSMVDSVRAAAQLFRGDDLSFAEKLTRLVGVPAAPVPGVQLEAMQAELSAMLERAGYRSGSLAERARRWEEERFVDPSTIEKSFDVLMLEAQERTDRLVYATADYRMKLYPVRDVSYTARCNFAEGRMDLNLDLRFSHAALKHLVAHEVFPGHSTQLLATRDWAASGRSTPDVLLCTANTVVGAIQEGIGDQGIHLIDWVESDDDALYLALRRLRTASATSAAWYQSGEGWALDKVRDFLETNCFPQAAWLEGRLRFAAHPFRGAFIASYWFGDEAVREARERAGTAGRTAFIEFLYGSMNSVSSMRQFGVAS
jgi:hypothetical protein